MIMNNTIQERFIGMSNVDVTLEELWERLGHDKSLAYHPWPQYDEKLCIDTIVTVAIQVNGKVRGEMDISKDIVEADAMKQAMDLATVQKYVKGKVIKKTVYVPGRILNIVVADK